MEAGKTLAKGALHKAFGSFVFLENCQTEAKAIVEKRVSPNILALDLTAITAKYEPRCYRFAVSESVFIEAPCGLEKASHKEREVLYGHL